MAVGAKHNETRDWPTCYKGELAICAAKHPLPDEVDISLSAVILRYWPECASVAQAFAQMPLGKVLCVVDLLDCVRTEESGVTNNLIEWYCGNYERGRFAWRTGNLRRLREPVAVVGRQGLFELPKDVEAEVRKQI